MATWDVFKRTGSTKKAYKRKYTRPLQFELRLMQDARQWSKCLPRADLGSRIPHLKTISGPPPLKPPLKLWFRWTTQMWCHSKSWTIYQKNNGYIKVIQIWDIFSIAFGNEPLNVSAHFTVKEVLIAFYFLNVVIAIWLAKTCHVMLKKYLLFPYGIVLG